MTGSVLIPFALFGWPVLSAFLFLFLGPRRAVLTIMVLGWALLPVAGYALKGFSDYDKATSLSLSVIVGTLLFDGGRWITLRPRWLDGVVALFCLVPLGSSLSNGLGIYDGLSSTTGAALRWGVPYLMGRLYFQTNRGLRTLAAGIVLGGVLYTPLCLYEIRMSPQLHNQVYGYHQHGFAQTKRLGGWRPMVFLQHGLAVGMWMASGSLLATGLAASGARSRLLGVPIRWVAAILIVTTVLVKSAGALILLFAGLLIGMLVKSTRQKALAYGMLLCSFVYVLVRVTGIWSGADAIEVSRWISDGHSDSLRVRLESENVLIEHALQRPWLGWAGWGRNRPTDHGGVVTDGLWVIQLSQHGMIGLGALLGMILAPAYVALRRAQVRRDLLPIFLAVLLGIYMIDSLMNAMFNPLMLAVAGGLGGWGLAAPRSGAGHRPRRANSARTRIEMETSSSAEIR